MCGPKPFLWFRTRDLAGSLLKRDSHWLEPASQPQPALHPNSQAEVKRESSSKRRVLRRSRYEARGGNHAEAEWCGVRLLRRGV